MNALLSHIAQIPGADALRGTRLEYEAKQLGITPDEVVQRLAHFIPENLAEDFARELMKPYTEAAR